MSHEDEHELRRGLRELADTEGPATGAPPTAALIAAGRRSRHRRRALTAAAATMVVAAGSALGVRWTGAAHDRAPTASGTASGTAPGVAAPGDTAATSTAAPDGVTSQPGGDGVAPLPPASGPYPPQPRSEKGEPLDSGPREPVENVRYRYDMSAVCGFRYVAFGGRVWEAEGADHAYSWVTDRAHGFIRLTTDPRTRAPVAVFEPDSPDPDRGTRVYRPRATTPACLADEPRRAYSDAPAATIGPAEPVEGARYAYDWSTVCDKRYLVFGGRLWKAEGAAAPGALECLVDGLPQVAHVRLAAGRALVTREDVPLSGRSRTYGYRPVDRLDAAERTGCPALPALQRLARQQSEDRPAAKPTR
ncbi:hypothetical protein [Streptomyces fradiae]|uniref:hypothetical protein n=1 Tax=Streptomyces fradiae TaxID=1906 RepID=UPI00294227CC|nr:hypothetical protein [Streptomyces fradiae]WOI62995.1 hypothetical protein RYQ63_25605 [Streptomyces fradiae]